MLRKIHIIGSVGSGKTTLARQLAEKMAAPHYELDNVVWSRTASGDVRRTDEEKQQLLSAMTSEPAWIMEGVHSDPWVEVSLMKADLIILLNTNYTVRNYRILKRFLRQKAGLEPSNYNPTYKLFFKMFKWNRYFEKVTKAFIYEQLIAYHAKIIIVSDRKDVFAYLEQCHLPPYSRQ